MTDCGRLLAIEEGTAQVHQLSSKRYKLFASPTVISQMSPSQFCVFKRGSTYDVWDMNNPIEPLRKKCQPGFTTYEAFGEGGYLFQVSESHKEIHVSEESSGDHIITFKLFSPLQSTLSHFSFLLSSQN
ncbi:hypothetical protein Pelo_8605 [Pelomyxa schiedti]|nr:hypothetical protein Pelo_8605 [Pelomyxa schiedti]